MSCESNCRSRTCKDIQIVKLMFARLGFQEVREGAKKTRLFRGHVPYQGGGESTPFPSKFFFLFFPTKCNKYIFSMYPKKSSFF